MEISNNKQIAKNTFLLYIRMFITLAVSFYTSRVILDILGVKDFGLYQVVGGVVTLFLFLNAALSGATSRFLIYELGKGDLYSLTKCFKMTVSIHILIALVILLLSETVGLWFVCNKLVIPEDRLDIVIWVFHFSVLTAVISIIQVPYTASIIAHEKMGIYAYVSIFDTIGRLLILYLLLLSSFDKLVTYSFLVFVVSLFSALIYILYSRSRFNECRYSIIYDKKMSKSILSFSAWELYGNLGVIGGMQGQNILLNLFFGTVANAACGIATRIGTAILGFSGNFMLAVKPQLTILYAQGKFAKAIRLMMNSSKYSFILMSLFSFPLLIECDFVLHIWLIDVPDYTLNYCRLTLLVGLVNSLFISVVYLIHATGRIKLLSILGGSISLLVLPLSYLCFKISLPSLVTFIISFFLSIVSGWVNLAILKKYICFFKLNYFAVNVLLPISYILLCSLPIPFLIYNNFPSSWGRFAVVTILVIVSIIVCSYFYLLSLNQRNRVFSKISNLFNL